MLWQSITGLHAKMVASLKISFSCIFAQNYHNMLRVIYCDMIEWQSWCIHCAVAQDCGIPFIHEVIMACPSCSAVAKQFRAWSGEVPGMAVVIAFTTSCSVCFSLCSRSTLCKQLQLSKCSHNGKHTILDCISSVTIARSTLRGIKYATP